MSEVGKAGSARALALEAAVAFGSSAVFFATCFTIRVKAIDRVGQVSGLASLGLRFTLAALVLVGLLVVAARWRKGVAFDRTTALVCAATAGIVSGMVAGGILVALHGTPYGLGGDGGDTAVLADWARRLQQGEPTPAIYPPFHIYGIAWLADLFHITTEYAMKQFQLLALVLVTPIAYVSWRLLLRPLWALGIGVTIALPMIEAYRLYPFIVLIAFLPVAIRFLEILRDAAEQDPLWLARRGVGFGAVFGLMFLTYSGWYEWSAPGFLVTALIVFPWKTAPRRALLLCGVGLLAFVVVSWNYLNAVLHGPPIADPFMYFDSRVDPSYIAMWRGDLPGQWADLWPPIGELGGVGLFTVLLAVGFGAAVALGRRTTAVLATVAIMVGAWLMRFWFAHKMWDTGLVQLYPRTTAELLYCLLALSGLAVFYAVEKRRLAVAPAHVIGVVCALLFLYEQAGSAISDKYMARELATDYGHMAWLALKTPRQDKNQTRDAQAKVSSDDGVPAHDKYYVIDRHPETTYSSAVSPTPEHEEWIEIHFPRIRTFSSVTLVPAADGFPVDYSIDVFDGLQWIPRITRTNQQANGPVELPFGRSDRTDTLRLHVTKLGSVPGGYALRLGELMVFR